VAVTTAASAATTGSTVISSRSSNKVDDVNKQEEPNIRSIDDLDLYDDDSDGKDDNINDNHHKDDARRIDMTTTTSVSTASLTLTDSSVDSTVSIESLEDYLDFGDQHIGSYRDSTDSSSDSSRGISRHSSSSSSRGGGGGRDDDDRSVFDGGGENIAEIIDLIDLRAEARFNRNYDEADRLRERLKRVGS
jgi:cysteinyl-tRNA synthetase